MTSQFMAELVITTSKSAINSGRCASPAARWTHAANVDQKMDAAARTGARNADEASADQNAVDASPTTGTHGAGSNIPADCVASAVRLRRPRGSDTVMRCRISPKIAK